MKSMIRTVSQNQFIVEQRKQVLLLYSILRDLMRIIDY